MHKPEFRIMIADEIERYFGLGSYVLLKEIEKTNSVKDAATNLDLSYSKAWKILNQAEKGAKRELVVRKQGGSQGGFTSLSDDGKRFILAYEKVVEEVEGKVASVFKAHFSWLDDESDNQGGG